MIRSYFGWERTPFTREIETRHLHRSQRFEECVARMKYMVMTRSIGCVTGEIGCGKSTAIRCLKDGLDANKYRFIYLSDANLQPRDFYRELLHNFGLPPKYLRSEAKRQFQHLVWDLYENQQKVVVVVIDEAHLLSGDMLQEVRFLTNFQIDSVSPLALLLIGQPELQATLQLRIFRPITQRMNIRFHLEGLSLQETRNYIEHQLEVAGSTHPVFTTEAMDAIYAHTRGISREINNICTAALLEAVLRKDKLIDAVHVSRVLTEFKEQ
ncbi:ExeA family protein [Paenibacillus harenae]|uniref:Type II secretory pathway predicted ATPase ExeA n=1 Tax=Paenibacillus harenae TaxID=306543 RepID=A0ABT9U7B2_PAEHA|nr:AAA family ATPase [Paenibacillus harenae]MDQ0114114.1 type II secretory pathway predicted ATPase ExeA [Paenibacillus harenae]